MNTMTKMKKKQELLLLCWIVSICCITVGVKAFMVLTHLPTRTRAGSRSTTFESAAMRPLPWRRRTLISSSNAIKYYHNSHDNVLFAQVDEQAEAETTSTQSQRIDINDHPNLYRIRLSRAPGIEWGTDLSFAFVYVRALEPSGPADLSNMVQVGDQICELTPINDQTGEVLNPIPLIGAPFDAVMSAFATLDKTIKEVDLVFFKGTKEELIQACNESNGDGASSATTDTDEITITVMERGKTAPITTLKAKKGVNVRELLTDNGINVYQSITRWTNCKGKQLCGTCIVNVSEGSQNTNRKSMDESSTLRENPESYRLSCITFAYGDITVETFPPITASQWTR